MTKIPMVLEELQCTKMNIAFFLNFFYSAFLLNVSPTCLKWSTLIIHIIVGVTVSQNFNLGLGFDFIDFRKKLLQNFMESYPNCQIR